MKKDKEILKKTAISLLAISILILACGVALGQNQTIENATVNVTEVVNTTENATANVTETTNVTEVVNATETVNESTNATANVTETTNVTETNATETVNATENATENATPTETANATEIVAPITVEEKTKAVNIAINLTVNIGIINPTIVNVERDHRDRHNLRVRLRDRRSLENIIVIVLPNGEAKPAIENVQSFTQVENNFEGKHVSFQFTNDSILNFTLEGKSIFKSIHLGFSSKKVTILGSELRIFDDDNMVIIHDDKSGIITESSSKSIESTCEVESDISPKLTGKRVDLSEVHASILSSNPESDEVVPSVSGNIIKITINNGKSTFIAKSLNDLFEDRVVEGIAENKIGNIVNIRALDSQDITTFGVDTTINQVIQNTVSINVSSDTPDGRIMAMRISKDLLTNLNLKIIVDGDEINPAANMDDLFKVDKLAYLIVIGQDAEVLVSIPKFSEHQIIVTSAAPNTATTGTGTSSGGSSSGGTNSGGNGTITGSTTVTETPVETSSTVTATQTPTVTVTETGTSTATNGTPVSPSPTKAPGFTIVLIIAVTAVLYLMLKNRTK